MNALAVSVGFLLLSLALVTGVLWTLDARGPALAALAPRERRPRRLGIYAVLVGARWLARQGATRAAQSAVAGFAILVLAVIGVGVLP